MAERRHRARALSGELGFSPGKGTKQIVVEFELLDEAHKGKRMNWIGYFTPATNERTLESLRICGWSTDDVTDLQGLGDNEVELVVDDETYNGKTYERVQFINRIGSGFKMKSPMSEAQKKAFAAEMRGLAVKSRSTPAASPATNGGSTGANVGKDDVPF